MASPGLVGVCDVLGYKSIVKRNNIELVARLIRETIQTLPSRIKKELESGIEAADGAKLEVLTRGFHTLVVSDTVLFAMPLPQDAPDDVLDWQWFYFIGYMAFLMRDAFDNGLPMRGAIASGEYLFIDNCFAGRAIIDAFELSHELEFSGAALTAAASLELGEVLKATGNTAHFRRLLFPYEAPLKRGRSNQLHLVSWFQSLHSPESPEPADVGAYVRRAFAAHNKDVPDDAAPKLQNTESVLTHRPAGDWEFGAT